MAILNVDHPLDQARRRVQPPPAGPPRQVDLRRAVSSAYYAVFHHVMTKAADEFVGVSKRGDARSVLVYRSVDHGTLRKPCVEANKPALAPKLKQVLPAGSFGTDIRSFASALIEMQERRHGADHDPALRLRTSDATSAIGRRTVPSAASMPRMRTCGACF